MKQKNIIGELEGKKSAAFFFSVCESLSWSNLDAKKTEAKKEGYIESVSGQNTMPVNIHNTLPITYQV